MYGQHPKTLPIEPLEASNPSAESCLQAINKAVNCGIENIQRNNKKMTEQVNKKRFPSPFKENDKVHFSNCYSNSWEKN